MRTDVWAITAYFNPAQSRRRRANYAAFRRGLTAPLVAVEWANDRPFELGPDDADILVQIRSPSVMWHKERLLNVALQHVPRQCPVIAWLDCDVLFANGDWAAEAAAQLRHASLVQPFDRVFNLPGDTVTEGGIPAAAADLIGRTFVSRFQSREVTLDVLRETGPSRPRSLLGLGWVAHRSLLASHHFYDAAIVGGGDRAMAMAGYGFFDDAIDALSLDGPSASHYLRWAVPFHSAVAGRIRAIEGDVCHLMHGSLDDRRYRQRHEPLRTLGFDPYTDIALSESGAWVWATDKPELHAHVRDYFFSRREDD